VREGSALDVWIDFTPSGSGYAGSFGSDGLRVLNIPLVDVRADSDSVRWQVVGDATTSFFEGRLAGDRLSGTFEDGKASGTFQLRRTPEPTAPPYETEAVRFANGVVTLSGTLLVPSSAGRHPAIVFVHGSGPEGRYASRYLADRFARAGFVALIYDKRGVGESSGDWAHSTFEDLAGDALAAVRMLAGDRRVRADAIGIHGHSQGGTIAPLIAAQWRTLAFVIASSAGGVPPPEAEVYSYRNFLDVARYHGADSLRAENYLRLIVRVAYEGQPWARADSAARANRNEKWFSGIPDSVDSFWWLAPRIASYDPLRYWQRVKSPVLLLYGERDERVPLESLNNIRNALAESGNTDVTTKVFADADHTFRIVESGDGKFHWPRTPPGYLQTLIGWARTKTRVQ
jgi:alpha-beta hydrolase superfamily lysophospholipase